MLDEDCVRESDRGGKEADRDRGTDRQERRLKTADYSFNLLMLLALPTL